MTQSKPRGSRDDRTVGECYASGRERLTALLRDLDDSEWDRDVDACPGWRVRDVLGHLVGIAEDAAAGTLSGTPDDAVTAEQVRRHHDDDPRELLDLWQQMAPDFEEGVTAFGIWPAFIDVWTHEQDVRGALGGEHAGPSPASGADASKVLRLLTRHWQDGQGPRAGRVVITTEEGDRVLCDRSDDGGSGQAPLWRLTTTVFEVNRLRLGRRTREQVEALDWSRPPGDWLDDLFTFGPRSEPLAY